MDKGQPNRRGVVVGLVAGCAGLALPLRLNATLPADDRRWTQAPDLPIRVQEIYPAALEDEIFVVGGLSPDAGASGISDRVFSWGPAQEEWREHARLPEPVHHPNGVGFGGRLYAIGGFTAAGGGLWSMTDRVDVYDPESGLWSPGPRLPQPAAEAVTGILNGHIHMVSGRRNRGPANAQYGDHEDTADHLAFDPERGRWESRAPVLGARNSAAGAVLNGRLHLVGGRTMAEGNTPDHAAYDPVADRWEAYAPLPEPAAGPRGAGGLAMAALEERLFVFGGEWFEDRGGVYHQVWSWNPLADAWEEVSHMPLPRHGLGAVTLGDAIYTVGGAAGPGIAFTSAAVHAFRPASASDPASHPR